LVQSLAFSFLRKEFHEGKLDMRDDGRESSAHKFCFEATENGGRREPVSMQDVEKSFHVNSLQVLFKFFLTH
jgi:hypothetical protein